jgi:hypothetical protein
MPTKLVYLNEYPGYTIVRVLLDGGYCRVSVRKGWRVIHVFENPMTVNDAVVKGTQAIKEYEACLKVQKAAAGEVE